MELPQPLSEHLALMALVGLPASLPYLWWKMTVRLGSTVSKEPRPELGEGRPRTTPKLPALEVEAGEGSEIWGLCSPN